MSGQLRQTIASVLEKGWGIDSDLAREACDRLVIAMDEAGLVIMPFKSSPALIEASIGALRKVGTIDGSKAQVERTKHYIRYKAIVQRQRFLIGLEDHLPTGLDDPDDGAV